MIFQSFFTKLKSSPRFILAGITTLGIIGVGVALLNVRAATSVVTSEPENATLATNAKIVNDTTASGGKAVQFTATTTPTGTRSCPAYPAMPDASCTGVPSGYALVSTNGSLTTSADGQKIDGKLIDGDLIVDNKNVVVTNTRITGRVVNNASAGLSVSDSDIGAASCSSSGSPFNNFNGTNYTLVRSHVHNAGSDLMGMGGQGTILIKDSIVDGACYYAGDHLDGIQFYGPGDVGNVTIQHTIIDALPVNAVGETGNSAVFWADTPGAGSRLTLTQSKFAGGNYMLSLYDANASSGVIIDVHDNTMVRNSYQYGACGLSDSILFNGTAGVKLANNKFEDSTLVPECN